MSDLTVSEIQTWWRKSVHLHAEVIFEEQKANDREEVDEKDGQNGRQNDGAAIPRYTLYHVEQRLLSDHQVEQLWSKNGIMYNRQTDIFRMCLSVY